ncbi:putative bifunctional diguanylate cyclase/phosphodiesterase [Pengzhenrongella sp.]|jgi:diguanylate cyclase (GGDEF)-like protein|uniref:putative bifunctional diguanylate cyclase/phosphodiesterase n=1 Tax=Pengzhenrongella sp. TaxID=2888820 RepID=UPI002F958BBF
MGVRFGASPAAGRLQRGLGAASWIVLSLGIAVNVALVGVPDGSPIRTGVVVLQGIFFVLLFARLLAAAKSRTGTARLSLLFIAAGVGLWAAGSVTLSAGQTVAAVSFPAPGEVFFLASYVGVASFLLLDVPRRAIPTMAIWLEAGVVCGAAACLAAFAVLMPLSGAFSRDGLPLLLAILYPLIDVILATVVLGQLMLRQRDRSVRTIALMVALLGLSAADSSLVLRLSIGAYTANIWLDAVWGLSFAVLVTAACARSTSAIAQPITAQNSSVLPLAAALAVVVLAVRPDGVIGWFVIGSAVVTLVCTGARMMMALREAQGAAEAHRLSLTDELTGLPNRRALLAKADDALRTGVPLGLALLDLDGFKDVNDSLGHAVGDDVLQTLAHRMRAALDEEVLVARLGGDEFALLALREGELGLFEIAQRIRAVLQNPLRVDNMDLAIDASVGITVREAGDTSSTELLRRADIAMYEAKSTGAGVLCFDASQDGFSRQRLRRGKELREAIAEDQLVVWYQPQVDARTRRVVAMEALVRWQHPEEGLLAPMTFLPDARLSGLMPALTEAVMRHAIADARRWIDEGFSFRIAVNCAPPELVGGTVLPKLFEALDKAGLPGECLLVEVTEDSFLAEPERAREALYDLRAHQVETSIDDYGTGFSSLAYLRDLPVQELKMDRSFVSTILTDERSLMIVQTTTQMAHALGLRLVAEGLEDAETAARLITMGVDVFQGYQIAKPMPADDVAPWVRRWAAVDGPGEVDPDDVGPEVDLSAGWAGPGRANA